MLKRAFDIGFSAGWLVGFAPLLLVVAILVRLRLGSPVFFIQERPGERARPFRMVKFRTMTDARGPDGQLLSDEERLTSFGRFLRATSLDEFPEMWNVLLGDMSVVGPRPLLMRYVARYDAFQTRRMEVKPGVTGWAQIDVWYVDHRTFWLDMKIVVMTFFKVLARSGAERSKSAPLLEEFRGNMKQ